MKHKLKSGSKFEIVNSNESSILSVSEAGSVTIAGAAVATQGEVPTKTSDLTNDSGFITGVSWGQVTGKPTFATIAETGSYNDLSNKPTIPTVNDATLTIQKNGTTVNTFTANASSNVTANITVPTNTSDLTNDSDFTTKEYVDNQVATKQDEITSTNKLDYSLIENTPTIPSVYDATLTIQKNGSSVGTFTANASSDKTVNIEVPTKTSDLTNDSGFATNSSVDTKIADLVDSAPEALNTLGELATALETHEDAYDALLQTVGEKANSADLATVATSGSYTDLSNKPTIPTVNNGTLTIQRNGTNVATFTANQSGSTTANISVPTVNDATLTIQRNGSSVGTFTANASANKSINITVPTTTSQLTNNSGYLTASDTTQLSVSATELNYLSGATSNVQTQINSLKNYKAKIYVHNVLIATGYTASSQLTRYCNLSCQVLTNSSYSSAFASSRAFYNWLTSNGFTSITKPYPCSGFMFSSNNWVDKTTANFGDRAYPVAGIFASNDLFYIICSDNILDPSGSSFYNGTWYASYTTHTFNTNYIRCFDQVLTLSLPLTSS